MYIKVKRERTNYTVKIEFPGEYSYTSLKDLVVQLPYSSYQYFIESIPDEFRTVMQEISDDRKAIYKDEVYLNNKIKEDTSTLQQAISKAIKIEDGYKFNCIYQWALTLDRLKNRNILFGAGSDYEIDGYNYFIWVKDIM